MGCWGKYDDEYDEIIDEWWELMKKVLPESMKSYELIREYTINNTKKIYNQILKTISELKKRIVKESYIEDIEKTHSIIVGICVKIVRLIQNLPQSDPLGEGIFDNKIPKELPKEYPEKIRLEALKSLRILIKIYDGNVSRSTETINRKKALQHELYFFTKGKEGIEGKHPKQSSKGDNRKGSKKDTKKGSKKVTKKSSKKVLKKSSKKKNK